MPSAPIDIGLVARGLDDKEALARKIQFAQARQRINSPPKDKDATLREACEGFESIFLQKMWEQMRKTVPKNDYLHSQAEETWQGMYDQELSKNLASTGGIGLGDMLYDQLKSNLDAARTSAPSRVLSPLPLNEVDTTTVRPRADLRPEPQTAAVAGVFDESQEALYGAVADEGETPISGPVTPELSLDGEASSPNAGASDLGSGAPGGLPPELASGMAADLAARIEKLGGAAEPSGGLYTSRPSAPSARRIDPLAAVSFAGETPDKPLVWPVSGRVSSPFGWRKDPFTGDKAWHAGIDLAAGEGEPVKACWDGQVIFSGDRGGYGKLVVIEHGGGWRSYYGHNADTEVRVGQRVKAGEHIADVGSTGRSTGNHLHFELRHGDQAWNPAQIRRRLIAGMDIGSSRIGP